MIEFVNKDNILQYSDFVNKYGNMFQSIEWIKANNIYEYGAIMCKEKEEIVIAGVYTFTIDKEKKAKVLYFPKGPIIKYVDKKMFKLFVDEIIKVARNNSCKWIRIDYSGNIGQVDEIEELLKNNNFKQSMFSKFWDYTWSIDIDGITCEDYLNSLKSKTRYNINYSKRKGVKVLTDNSFNSINKFYELLQITSKRDNFKIKSKDCYENLISQFKNNINVFWAYKDEVLLSAAIEVIFANKAYYLYGASSNRYRNLQSTFLLQNKMIEYAIIRKCTTYEMGGVGIRTKSGDKYYDGLLNFKQKFGGKLNKNIYSYILEV